MTILKKSIAVIFCIIVLTVQTLAPASAQAEVGQDTVQIVLQDTEDKIIIAEVDQDHADEYSERIETDSAFREAEIAKLNRAEISLYDVDLSKMKLVYTSSAYKSNMKNYVDNKLGNGYFETHLHYALSQMASACGAASGTAFFSAILSEPIQILQGKSALWWSESYDKIIIGRTQGIRVSHYENWGSDYPKTYVTIERLL